MPNMDGFAACRAIRDLPNGATVPIMMVTGGDDLEAVTNAYEAGATDFVSKPINWPILGHRVLYVLRASDAIVRLRIADAQNRAVLAAIPDTFFRMIGDGFYLDYEPGREGATARARRAAHGRAASDAAPLPRRRMRRQARHRGAAARHRRPPAGTGAGWRCTSSRSARSNTN